MLNMQEIAAKIVQNKTITLISDILPLHNAPTLGTWDKLCIFHALYFFIGIITVPDKIRLDKRGFTQGTDFLFCHKGIINN